MSHPVTAEHVIALAATAKEWPTVTETSDRTGVPVRTLHRAINSGRVVAFKTNVTRIEPASLAAWLTARY